VATGDTAGTSRLAAALAAVDAKVSWLQVRVGRDDRPGWVPCSDLLAEPGRLQRWQQQTADAYGVGEVDPSLTAAGLVLDWYLAAVVVPAVAAFHLQRVVPDLTPSRLSLLPGPAGAPAAAVALLRPEPVAVDADPHALRDQVGDHAEAFLAAYAPLTRFGRRTRWAAVTDAVDTAFLTAGWVSGRQRQAAQEAASVLGHDRAGGWRLPGAGGSTLHEVTDARGRRHWTRRRHGCCFLYRIPGIDACLTCPRVSDEHRAEQAVGWD